MSESKLGEPTAKTTDKELKNRKSERDERCGGKRQWLSENDTTVKAS